MGNAVVYRPAYDAEVEYLESTGTQWIDTGFRPDSTTTSFELDISFEGAFVYSGTSKTIIRQSVIEMDNQFCMNFGDGPNQGGDIFLWFGRNYDGLGGASVIANVALTRGIFRYLQGIVSYSGKSVDVNNSSFPPTIGRREGTMCILKDLECYNARLYGVKIWDNNVLVRDFIPVRIGSVGYMYDKVTKQLFANKGTGNFILGSDVSNAVIPQQRCVLYFGSQRSVGFERIYEEYEWLVGDGSAFIDTGKVFESSDNILTRINITELPTNYFFIYGNDAGDHDYTLMSVLFSNSNAEFRPQRTYAYMPKGSYDVIHNLDGVSINGTKVIDLHKDYVYNNKSIYIFTSHYLGESKLHFPGDIAYFKITDTSSNTKMDLIPCTLSIDLPAYMDANNIPRTKGTSGMWDKVSGRFFGNVASSGTFKAVNLAEGVDYEVYDWLVGDRSAYISGITYNLWDNHLVSQIYNMDKSYHQFVQSDINLNDRNISMTRNSIYLQIIFRESSQTNITHIADLNPNDFSGAIDLDYYISDSNFNVKVNGVTYTNATSVYATESKWNSFDGLLIYSEKMSYIREVTPSGIYVSNLIPVKLLKSIPSKYDANGISRNAGECGMYDTVNDVFYGNVASSGTFTVSND